MANMIYAICKIDGTEENRNKFIKELENEFEISINDKNEKETDFMVHDIRWNVENGFIGDFEIEKLCKKYSINLKVSGGDEANEFVEFYSIDSDGDLISSHIENFNVDFALKEFEKNSDDYFEEKGRLFDLKIEDLLERGC